LAIEFGSVAQPLRSIPFSGTSLPLRAVPPLKFRIKVGDHLKPIGVLVPEYMREGTIIRVIPNDHGQDLFNEYEVNFGNQLIAIFYETQLRLVASPENAN
jgi:hypothetical protein